MASNVENKSVQTETYEGPSKIGVAMDSAVSWGSVVYGLAIIAGTMGKSFSRRATNWVSGAVGVVAGVFGYFSAAKGERQFEAMKGKLSESDARAATLQAQVNGLTQEVATYRKSYAHGVQSRAEQGSHVEAAQADKAAAAEAAAAR
jgi:hypothetical protein